MSDQPKETSAELAEAEQSMREEAAAVNKAVPGIGGRCAVVIAELDRLRATEKALRDLMDAMNVCHVCGDQLAPDDTTDGVAAGTRCLAHPNAQEGDSEEPWHITRAEWKRRWAAAAQAAEAVGQSALSSEQPSLDCDHCGCVAIESFTGIFYSGDGGHCRTCGFPGSVSCDSETPPYWMESDEDDATCADPDCDDCSERDPGRVVGERPFVKAAAQAAEGAK